MSAYDALAASYDSLTGDVDYEAVICFYETILRERNRRPETVLDLACGTGSLSLLLSQSGYRVIGADASPEMLTLADRKAAELGENRPYFVCQSMQELELPEPVELVVSCLDSINYLTDPADCAETFRRVYRALRTGGVFLFDVNTPEKLRGLDGQVFLDENDDTYCVWRAEFDEGENICYYGMDLFQRAGKLWRRSFEEHSEYAYSREKLAAMLAEAGFSCVTAYGDRKLSPPEPGEQRIYFAAEKE